MLAQFLQQQLDYIFFIYGFVFVLLGAICIALSREKSQLLPWIWLALFGFTHGVNEWLEMLTIGLGDGPIFSMIRLVVMTLSFLFLFEFGRDGLSKLQLKIPGRWIYAPLMALTLLGGLAGTTGLNAAARYIFAFFGGLLSATALFRGSKIAKNPPLAYAAIIMVIYAFVAGILVPKASFYPAAIINSEAFLSVTGIPAQVVKSLLAILIAATLWRYAWKSRQSDLLEIDQKARWNYGIQIIIVLFLILTAGWIFAEYVARNTDQIERGNILNQTTIAASAIDPENVRRLTGTTYDEALPDYIRLRQQIVDMGKSNPNLRWLYLMLMDKGKVIFEVDSVPLGANGFTPPGQVYEQPPKELIPVFNTGQTITVGPYKDEFGSFVSAYAALKDPMNQRIMAVVGADVNADYIQKLIAKDRLIPMGITLLIALIFTGFFLVREEMWESEQRISASEKRLATAQKIAQMGSWTIEPKTLQVNWSDEMFRMLGRDPKCGPPGYLEREKYVQPDDWPAFYAANQRAILEGEGFELEWRAIREDGTVRTMISRAEARRGNKGEIIQVLGTSQDITEVSRARMEIERQKEYFEALVRNNPVAILTMDTAANVVTWNPAAEKLFGYTAQEAAGRNVDDLIANAPEIHDQAKTFNLLAIKEAGVHAFTQRTRKDGSKVDIELMAVPVYVAGEQSGLIAIYHDITELLQAKREAEAANEAKSSFLAMMSHEIRTPMNGVIGMTSLLLDTDLTEEQFEFVETVRYSGESLLDIINDILDFSKVEAGKLELECQPFDLRECIESATDLAAAQAADRGLDLAYLIDPQLPSAYSGDVTRVRQILINLLGNALKFTEEGEVVASVIGQAVQTAAGDPTQKPYELHFSVRDTGIGIPADRMDRLFKSFSQVDSSTTRKYGGTGLGLAISARLSKMMGGKMWVESSGVPGEGSNFHFTILVPAIAEQQAHPGDNNKINIDLSGMKVLIVDDNMTNRQILLYQTTAWGMKPTAVESGPEALVLIRQGVPFDIALLDFRMPAMDGLTLANEIRKSRTEPSLPMVLLSSYGYRESQSEQSVFSARLTKPIKPSQLLNILGSVMFKESAPVRKIAMQEEYDRELGMRHPLRLLLAEDSVVNQKVALNILERLGYRADLASNGLEVLEALKRQPYDVILMDGHMPEMDGEEATAIIRQDWPVDEQPRIIAMTANALLGDRERYLAMGMDDYVSKPIKVEELIRVLALSRPINVKVKRPTGGLYQTGSLRRTGGLRYTGSLRQTGSLKQAVTVEPSSPDSPESEDKPSVIFLGPPTIKPTVDYSLLREFEELMGEDGNKMVREIIALFLTNTPKLFNDMEQSITEHNNDLLRRAAHTLKGNSGNVGALQLASLSGDLEKRAKEGTDGAKTILTQIEQEYERVKIELEAQLRGKQSR